MGLFENLFKKITKQSNIKSDKNESKEMISSSATVPLPENHSITMSKLALDMHTVLLSDHIESKQTADLYASLISEKYGVKTKVTVLLGGPHYSIFVYKIDLHLIKEYYNPTINKWSFNLSTLNRAPKFNYTDAIDSTDDGMVVNAHLTNLLQTDKYCTCLFETPYYQFYKYHSNTLLRYDKEIEETLVVGRFVHIDTCIQFRNKLYIAKSCWPYGDSEIFQCDLNGANLIALHCLSNEKTVRAGHLTSEDTVKKMRVVDNSLEITVKRDADSGIYDYKIFITENDGNISIVQEF